MSEQQQLNLTVAPRPTREIDTSSCTDPDCPICHGSGGHGDGWSNR